MGQRVADRRAGRIALAVRGARAQSVRSRRNPMGEIIAELKAWLDRVVAGAQR
jgi:hypothetical protein